MLRRSTKTRLRLLPFLFALGAFLEVCWVRHNIRTVESQKTRDWSIRKRVTEQRKKIYIASPLWNADRMMRGPWGNWSASLLRLAEDFGPENVFVTILEGGSYDFTKDALGELDADLERLGVRRNITMEKETHRDFMAQEPGPEGWVKTSKGTTELRRIPFLAKLRNRTLQPLRDMWAKGERFDYVLFLGDVQFNSEDISTLINTNDGDYAAACSLDFAHPPLYYDTFVLRDTASDPTLQTTWPYFRSKDSRNAIKRHLPVPVSSCWNGIVSMPASIFTTPTTPLTFRALSDPLASHHYEASECCLIHADNPLSATKPILLNPAVRVGYNHTAYDAVHAPDAWLSFRDIFEGLWGNRMKRWISFWFQADRGRQGYFLRSLEAVKEKVGVREGAAWCVVDEMQVLTVDGWTHV
ncbi:glycosyltransferase family 69 protein [Venturia nashicola]|uniref:Glycosyltransferase family 69 protein n=1 Tax=Venturia nashicola TaxID=86259 RepID=A0A4Z1PFX0_9PEZI|nr:glycosyltransferase family 69 protein [Venturia nashicola]